MCRIAGRIIYIYLHVYMYVYNGGVIRGCKHTICNWKVIAYSLVGVSDEGKTKHRRVRG